MRPAVTVGAGNGRPPLRGRPRATRLRAPRVCTRLRGRGLRACCASAHTQRDETRQRARAHGRAGRDCAQTPRLGRAARARKRVCALPRAPPAVACLRAARRDSVTPRMKLRMPRGKRRRERRGMTNGGRCRRGARRQRECHAQIKKNDACLHTIFFFFFFFFFNSSPPPRTREAAPPPPLPRRRRRRRRRRQHARRRWRAHTAAGSRRHPHAAVARWRQI